MHCSYQLGFQIGKTEWQKFKITQDQNTKKTKANKVLCILPKQIKDNGEHLGVGHASQKPGYRKVFLAILENRKTLARQGLPFMREWE